MKKFEGIEAIEMVNFEGVHGSTFICGHSLGYVKIIEPGDDREVLIPFMDIKDFIADYVRKEKIQQLNKADSDDILGLIS